MKITKEVTDLLERIEKNVAPVIGPDANELNAALLEAERMADEFKHVKPTPYIVPIEKAVGAYRTPESENNA